MEDGRSSGPKAPQAALFSPLGIRGKREILAKQEKVGLGRRGNLGESLDGDSGRPPVLLRVLPLQFRLGFSRRLRWGRLCPSSKRHVADVGFLLGTDQQSLLRKLWSPNQQQQKHLEACWKCGISGPLQLSQHQHLERAARGKKGTVTSENTASRLFPAPLPAPRRWQVPELEPLLPLSSLICQADGHLPRSLGAPERMTEMPASYHST